VAAKSIVSVIKGKVTLRGVNARGTEKTVCSRCVYTVRKKVPLRRVLMTRLLCGGEIHCVRDKGQSYVDTRQCEGNRKKPYVAVVSIMYGKRFPFGKIP